MLAVARDNMGLLFLCYIQATECQLKLSPKTKIHLLRTHIHLLRLTGGKLITGKILIEESSKDLPSSTEASMPMLMHNHKNNYSTV